jgi:hypothetical protein
VLLAGKAVVVGRVDDRPGEGVAVEEFLKKLFVGGEVNRGDAHLKALCLIRILHRD